MGYWAAVKDYYEFSREDISDLLVTAFEGGINYWCAEIEIDLPPDDAPNNFYLSDVISYGGTLKLRELTDEEDEQGEVWILDIDKMITGIEKYCALNSITLSTLLDNHDAESADQIVQYALFNELVYG